MSVTKRLQLFFRKPHNVILVVLFFLLAVLTFLPLLSILTDTFTVHTSEVMRIRGTHAGDFTFYHWQKVLADGDNSLSIFYKPLLNTLAISLATCAIAIGAGGSMAWLITRTNIKYKPVLSALFVIPYIMPAWTLALAWLNFFRNALVGGVPGLFTVLTGLTDLPLGVEQGGEIHFAGFVAGQCRLESQFGLRQQAGCGKGLGPPRGIEQRHFGAGHPHLRRAFAQAPEQLAAANRVEMRGDFIKQQHAGATGGGEHLMRQQDVTEAARALVDAR